MSYVADHATTSRPVLVIGGGVVGICCAYYLQLAGIPVILAEASTLGAGVSSGNLGLLAASHSMPLASPGVAAQALGWLFRPNSPFSIELPPSAETMRWLWTFLRASHSTHFAKRASLLTSLCLESIDLFQELSSTFQFHSECKGTLEVFLSPKAFDKFKKQLPAMQTAGIKVELLDETGTKALAPVLNTGIAGGAFYPFDCTVDPQCFMNAARSQLRIMGTIIREDARVVRLRTEQGLIKSVDFEHEMLEVAGVVLATGFHVKSLLKPLGLHMPVQAARGYTFDFPDAPDWPEMSLMFAEAKLLTTALNARRRLGGYLYLANPQRKEPPCISLERLTKSLIEYIGESAVEEMCRTASPVWSGYRPCSPDGLPIIGLTTAYQNLCLATGHGMLGLTLAPVTGKRVAQIIQGEESVVTQRLLGPNRFGRLGF